MAAAAQAAAACTVEAEAQVAAVECEVEAGVRLSKAQVAGARVMRPPYRLSEGERDLVSSMQL